MDIRIYDYDFKRLHIEYRYSSALWFLYYNEIGTFELHFDKNSELINILLERTEEKPCLVAVQGEYQADIISFEINDKEAVLYGKTINNVLNNRVIPTFKDKKGTADSLVKGFITDYYDFVTYVNSSDFTEEFSFWRNTYNNGFEVIRDCLKKDNGGHKIVFDYKNKVWELRAYKGIEKNLIISSGNRNCYEKIFTRYLNGYATSGWYEQQYEDKGEWDGSINKPNLSDSSKDYFSEKYRVTVGGTLGGVAYKAEDYIGCDNHNRIFKKINSDDTGFWIYLDNDSEKTGVYKKESVLTGQTQSEAQEALNKLIVTEEINSKTKNLVYGVDYNLGDIVRIQLLQRTFKRRITGINIWFESNNIGYAPVFEEVTE